MCIYLHVCVFRRICVHGCVFKFICLYLSVLRCGQVYIYIAVLWYNQVYLCIFRCIQVYLGVLKLSMSIQVYLCVFMCIQMYLDVFSCSQSLLLVRILFWPFATHTFYEKGSQHSVAKHIRAYPIRRAQHITKYYYSMRKAYLIQHLHLQTILLWINCCILHS